jgi:hypothetical protein
MGSKPEERGQEMNARQIWFLNATLGALLIWGAVKVVDGWKAFEASHQVSQLETKPDTGGGRVVVAEAKPTSPAVNEAWLEIASRNPFSFDRNDVNVVEAKAPPVAGPKPVLYGTLVMGDDRLALMGKAGSSTRTGPPVKVGETFEGWKVTKIDSKSVLVTSNGVEESLVVGRVPVVRNTEKTATAAQPQASEPSVPLAPAAAPATPAARATEAAIKAWRPGMPPPPGTHVVNNPFGQVLQQDGQ